MLLMLLVVLSLIGVGLLLCVSLCAIVLLLSTRAGWLDRSGSEAHKQHERAVANTGGVAIFWAVTWPLAALIVAAWLLPKQVWPHDVARYLPGLQSETFNAAILLGALLIIHLLGLIDDRVRLGPLPKMLVMMLIAALLTIAADMRILHQFDHLGAGGYLLSVALSVLWITLIINAFNFLDNMDGLSAGVAMILAGLYLIITLAGGQWFVAGLCALLAGALLGFLAFNLPPARLFMGDGGSLVVGTLMAVISVRTTYYNPLSPELHAHAIIMPIVMMSVPLYDLLSVTLVRLLAGRSPFRGDQNHFSHRLVRLGLSKQRAVGLIWLCVLATGMSGLVIGWLEGDLALIIGIQALVILAILAVLETGVRRL